MACGPANWMYSGYASRAVASAAAMADPHRNGRATSRAHARRRSAYTGMKIRRVSAVRKRTSSPRNAWATMSRPSPTPVPMTAPTRVTRVSRIRP
ncbi:hypothetical protein ACFQX7_23675 [Luedemannella flava]